MDDLLKRVEILEKEIQRLKDRAQIENLMSKYQYYYTARMDKEILDEMWADGNIGATVEDGYLGVYENKDGSFPDGGITAYYAAAMNIGSPKEYPGKMTVYTNTTQMIEVAEDGKTAKGIWISIGTESDAGDYAYDNISPHDDKVSGIKLDMKSKDGKRYQADWVWQKYGVDFIRQNGEWKIWHLHIYQIFRCPFNQDWVSFAAERGEEYHTKLAAERCFNPYGKPPGQGSTYFWEYNPESVTELEPKPPVFYRTFKETFSY